MSQQSTWHASVSFEDRVIFLFETKQTEGEEFQIYLRIYGRERLAGIWKKYQELKGSVK